MKYFGVKSLSSFFSVLLAIAWPTVLILAICGAALFGAAVFSDKVDTFLTEQMQKDVDTTPKDMQDWEKFRRAPVAGKLLLLPYGGFLAYFLLMIIGKSKQLFDNLKKEIIFNKSNVELMKRINKFLLIFSIMTFNFSGILTCVLLLMLIEILQNGTALQEEYDLTV